MVLDAGNTVFVLVPRHVAIHKAMHVNKTLSSLYAMDKAKAAAEEQGKRRIAVAEDGGKYTTIGLKPYRGSSSIRESWPKKLRQDDRDQIIKLMTGCKEVAKGYLPPGALWGLRVAKVLGDWPEISGGPVQSLYGSLASGKNVYLNMHTDEDFFYSLTTVGSTYGVRHDIDRYSMDAVPSNYFMFAEQGIAVALRPGDMLLFNPQYQHCISSRTSHYSSECSAKCSPS